MYLDVHTLLDKTTCKMETERKEGQLCNEHVLPCSKLNSLVAKCIVQSRVQLLLLRQFAFCQHAIFRYGLLAMFALLVQML